MLDIHNLHVNYGHILALRGASLSVREQEVVALIGNNGAGKSTLLRTISGLLNPASGSISFRGKDITGMHPSKIARAGIVHVPEGRRIFAKLSVHENLMMGAYTRKDKKAIQQNYEWVVEIFPKMKERLKQPGGTLSGGEQQMLAVGRAIMSEPKLLLLDEPSLGLAPLVVEVIADTVRKIAASGIAILIVEQNANLALELSHRAYVLDVGVIDIEGPSKELAANDKVRQVYLGIN